MDPITSGEYPKSMQSLVGDRLPRFSKEESKMLKGSFDFLGLNYYTANYAADAPKHGPGKPSYLTDASAKLSSIYNLTHVAHIFNFLSYYIYIYIDISTLMRALHFSLWQLSATESQLVQQYAYSLINF